MTWKLLNVAAPDLSARNVNVAPATVARTIPGLRNARVAVPRKPVASVRFLDDANDVRFDHHPTRRAVSRSLSALVLPLAPEAQHRGRVLLNSVLAYTLVFLSLAIVHIPFVLRAGARSLEYALRIFWGDLVSSHLGHLLLCGTLIALLSYTEGLFDVDGSKSSGEHILIAVKVAFWATLVIGVSLRLCGIIMDALTLVSSAVVIVAELAALAAVSRCLRARTVSGGKRSKNVLVIGTTTTAVRVAKCVARDQNGGRMVKGFISRYDSGAPGVLGSIDELAHIARSEFIDEIVIACGQDRDLAERAVAEAVRNHLDVSIVPELFMECPTCLCVQTLGGMPLISVHQEPIPWCGLLVKRIMDTAISAIALLLLLPLMMVIAAAIRFESHGGVLYAALRVGKKGRTFQCYKFRTMYPDADRTKDLLRARNQRQGPTFKIVNDPRITPLGRILRRYSLDELPQLWNVLNGSMSLVGPRPHPVDDYQRYALADRRRLDVAPGITGLWQVSAREDPSFSTNMALDLEYIENWSLGMDLAIFFKTLPAVLAGTGA